MKPQITADERFVLRAGELLRPLMDILRVKLPPRTDFGIIIIAPEAEPGEEGRVIAMSTDRRRIGLAAAQWIVNAEPFGKEGE